MNLIDWFLSLNLPELLGMIILFCLVGLAIFICTQPPTPNYREQEHIKKVYGETQNENEESTTKSKAC